MPPSRWKQPGFAQRGEGWKQARERRLTLDSEMPICTLGGAKARGNPLGAAGVYQIVEAVLQLRGQAGPQSGKRGPARGWCRPWAAGFNGCNPCSGGF